MQLLGNKVLVKPFESDSMTSGGLYVPDNCKEVSNKVLVMAVGVGSPKKPMFIKPGDIAFRIKDCGEKVIFEGQDCFLIDQSWLLAKLN